MTRPFNIDGVPPLYPTSRTTKAFRVLHVLLLLALTASNVALWYKGGYNLDTVQDSLDAATVVEGDCNCTSSSPLVVSTVGQTVFSGGSDVVATKRSVVAASNGSVPNVTSASTTILNERNETIVFEQENIHGHFWEIRNFTSDMQWQSTSSGNLSVCRWDGSMSFFAAVPEGTNLTEWESPLYVTMTVMLPPPYQVQDGMVPPMIVQTSRMQLYHNAPAELISNGRFLDSKYIPADDVHPARVTTRMYFLAEPYDSFKGHDVTLTIGASLANSS